MRGVVHIQAEVTIHPDDVPQAALDDLVSRTTHNDPEYRKRVRMGVSVIDLSPTLTTHRWTEEGELVVWRGVLGDVLRILRRHGVHLPILDDRLWLPPAGLRSGITLRGYQEKPFKVMCRRQQAIGRGAAGCGKTEIHLATIAHFDQPTLVLVWHQRQQQVWIDRVRRHFGFTPGGIGGGFKREEIQPITIGMVQSVRNRMDWVPTAFGAVVCDEVQRFGAATFREVVNRLPAAVRLGASDDERRRDRREFLLYDTFGPLAWRLRRNQGQCPIDIYVVPTSFSAKGITFSTPWSDVVTAITSDERRNKQVVGVVRQLVNRGRRVLVWSDRVDHCKELQRRLTVDGIPSGLLIGGKENEKEAAATEAGLLSGVVKVGVGTSVAEQSINIPELSAGVMTCASADPDLLRFRQMRGRLARPNPKDPSKRGTLIYLWDRNVPVLRQKVGNIKRGYAVRMPKEKECEMPTRKTTRGVITLETLTAGCSMLGIKVPAKAATEDKVRNLIVKELSKSEQYGGFCCEDCGSDIVLDGLTACPFCGASFVWAPSEDIDAEEDVGGEEYVDEGEEGAEVGDEEEPGDEDVEPDEYVDEGEEGEEEAGAVEEDTYYVDVDLTEAAEWDDEGGVANAQYADEGDNPVVYDANGNGWSVTDGGLEPYGEHEEPEAEEEQEEEEEAPPPRKSRRQKQEGQARKEALAAKRAQVEKELPYSAEQLGQMKRPVLVMVASVLGVANPASLGGNDRLIKVILRAQAQSHGTDPATGMKKKAAPRKPVKAAPQHKPSKKAAAPPARRPAKAAPPARKPAKAAPPARRKPARR